MTNACAADTDGSSLAAGITAAATSLQAATLAGLPLWTTSPDDVPFDVIMSGERITVGAISGTTSPQTMTVTRSVNGVVKGHAAGEPIALFQPCYFALA